MDLQCYEIRPQLTTERVKIELVHVKIFDVKCSPVHLLAGAYVPVLLVLLAARVHICVFRFIVYTLLSDINMNDLHP